MVAAMGVGICYAVWVPGEAQTRLLIGGLIVPVVWGAVFSVLVMIGSPLGVWCRVTWC